MEVFPASRCPKESRVASMLECDTDRRRSPEPNSGRGYPRGPDRIFQPNIDDLIQAGLLIDEEHRSRPADVHLEKR